jgi:hypothetical protein
MDKIQIIEIDNLDGTTTQMVLIDRGNDEFTSMPKSTYDAMQAEQSTPSFTNGNYLQRLPCL